MILKSRLYTREEPSRDARLVIIYCEGKKREDNYFNYFVGISSQIKLEIESPEQHDDTSPMGLHNKAVAQLIISKENPEPKYPLSDSDEVWFVIDTDSWGTKINELRNSCAQQSKWFVVQSNPCFEVWLYYHFNEFEEFDGMDISNNWKTFLNQKISGGFDSRKHPVFIKTAIANARKKLSAENENLNIGCTEVYKLAESFYPLLKEKIEQAILKLNN